MALLGVTFPDTAEGEAGRSAAAGAGTSRAGTSGAAHADATGAPHNWAHEARQMYLALQVCMSSQVFSPALCTKMTPPLPQKTDTPLPPLRRDAGVHAMCCMQAGSTLQSSILYLTNPLTHACALLMSGQQHCLAYSFCNSCVQRHGYCWIHLLS